MNTDSIRGSSLNHHSYINDPGSEFEPRQVITFECEKCGRVTSVTFAQDAEIAGSWPCKFCGTTALSHEAKINASGADEPRTSSGKTPFEMLLERRTRDELEEILAERLNYYRQRRGDEE